MSAKDRGLLARILLRAAGLPPTKDAAEEVAVAEEDDAFAEMVVEALVTIGSYNPAPEQRSARSVRVEDLRALPPSQELHDSLDKRRARPLNTLEQVRLAQMYALIGHQEKAAACMRVAFASREPMPLALAVDIAEAAAASGNHSLALAAVDWVAECLLTRDEVSEGPRSNDPVRRDPLAMGSILERAQRVAVQIGFAPRAVALCRTAASIYERMGRQHEVRDCLASMVRALRAEGDAKKATTTARRLHRQTEEEAEPADVAAALAVLAEQLTATREFKEAIQCHKDAAKLHGKAGDLNKGLESILEMARLQVRAGLLEHARKALDEAVEQATRAGLKKTALRLQGEETLINLHTCRIAEALGSAEALRKGWEDLGDEEEVAEAVVHLAHALALAGDSKRAYKALNRCALDARRWETAGRSLRVRAELSGMLGREDEARMLLVDAARSLSEAKDNVGAGEAMIRRAELSLDSGDAEACMKDLKRCKELVGALDSALELRADILRARLCEDPDEKEILLDEVHERAQQEGLLPDRVQAASAKARHHLSQQDPGQASETLRPVIEEIIRVKGELPKSLQEGFKDSPLCHKILELEAALAKAKAQAK